MLLLLQYDEEDLAFLAKKKEVCVGGRCCSPTALPLNFLAWACNAGVCFWQLLKGLKLALVLRGTKQFC